MKKKLLKKIFRDEIKAYEKEIIWLNEIIKDASIDSMEQNEMLLLYEEEIERLEKENKILTLIIGSLKLYEGRDI